MYNVLNIDVYLCQAYTLTNTATNMKAIIVKNNEFQTIGFEVTDSAKTLFSWGISPSSPLYWTKTVNVNDWMTEIFELVRLEAQIIEANQFVRDFFTVASANELLKEGKSVKFEGNQNRIARLGSKMENIIKNII